mmetsp:Transcript_60171/g.138021  ORF Transcript_60171/g.138021 Transcript_60171/m.138021 type:complete len:228 (-) Transcript_60171:279-962(-)
MPMQPFIATLWNRLSGSVMATPRARKTTSSSQPHAVRRHFGERGTRGLQKTSAAGEKPSFSAWSSTSEQRGWPTYSPWQSSEMTSSWKRRTREIALPALSMTRKSIPCASILMNSMGRSLPIHCRSVPSVTLGTSRFSLVCLHHFRRLLVLSTGSIEEQPALAPTLNVLISPAAGPPSLIARGRIRPRGLWWPSGWKVSPSPFGKRASPRAYLSINGSADTRNRLLS